MKIGTKVIIWDNIEDHVGYTKGEILTVMEDVSDTGMPDYYECMSDTTGIRYLCGEEEIQEIKTQG